MNDERVFIILIRTAVCPVIRTQNDGGITAIRVNNGKLMVQFSGKILNANLRSGSTQTVGIGASARFSQLIKQTVDGHAGLGQVD